MKLLIILLISYCVLGLGPIDLGVDTTRHNYDIRLYKGSMNDTNSWCGTVPSENLPGLDDRDCIKVFPSKFSRDWSCTSYHTGKLPGYYKNINDAKAHVENVLAGAVPPSKANIAVVLVKRSLDDGMAPYYRILSNGNHLVPYYAWSSTKEFAMSAAAGRLNELCGFGMDAMEYNTGTPLGDWATVIATYDKRFGYSSNGQSRYFSDIAGRNRERHIIRNVIGATHEDGLANWGAVYPTNLGFKFNTVDGDSCTIDPITDLIFDNEQIETNVSTLTEADWLRRIVLHREIDEHSRIPSINWNDAATILYGAGTNSRLFGDKNGELQYGGLSMDTSVWMQKASGNMKEIDTKSKGQWRIFSKMGCGYTSIRNRFEFVYNSYTCQPVIDDKNVPVPNSGVEIVMSVMGWNQNEPALDSEIQQYVNAAYKIARTL